MFYNLTEKALKAQTITSPQGASPLAGEGENRPTTHDEIEFFHNILTEARKSMDTKKFDVGDFGEGYPWEIRFNQKISLAYSKKPCPHCHSHRFEEKLRSAKETYLERYVICPRTVVSYNEGKHNCTEVCLDCILDAEKSLTEARNHENSN